MFQSRLREMWDFEYHAKPNVFVFSKSDNAGSRWTMVGTVLICNKSIGAFIFHFSIDQKERAY